jgi:hypothetical protein
MKKEKKSDYHMPHHTFDQTKKTLLHRRNATVGMIVTWIRFSIWHGDDAG